jgi:hypothetical protein
VVSAIADISRIAHDASATGGELRWPPTPNRLQAFLLPIPLDLFALFRSRSTGDSMLSHHPPDFLMLQRNIRAVNSAAGGPSGCTISITYGAIRRALNRLPNRRSR